MREALPEVRLRNSCDGIERVHRERRTAIETCRSTIISLTHIKVQGKTS